MSKSSPEAAFKRGSLKRVGKRADRKRVTDRGEPRGQKLSAKKETLSQKGSSPRKSPVGGVIYKDLPKSRGGKNGSHSRW